MLGVAKRTAQAALKSFGLEVHRTAAQPPPKPPQANPTISAADRALLERFAPYTMTTPARQNALLRAVRYINAAAIPGAIVECGVWRGGSMMIAKAACEGSSIRREFFLFDTFDGMSAPTAEDVKATGQTAVDRLNESPDALCLATLEDVRANFEAVGMADTTLHFVKGMVEDTLRSPEHIPDPIALLRLDTDFYESTKRELEVLYPRLVTGGVLIIDDYGSWLGARKAVDEYFASRPILLSYVGQSGVIGVKT